MGNIKSDFKIVQSFWSKPLLESRSLENLTGKVHKKSGGWLSEEAYYMSCALSCLKLKEFYNNVELVTDEFGKKLLIDYLNLPYSNVRTDLEDINNLSEDLWAIGKLIAYKIQEEPFIHVDNDVFIWEAFPEKLLMSEFLVQHEEGQLEFGKKLCEDILKNLVGFTPELLDYTQGGGMIDGVSSYNFGVFGGTNIDFIKFYVDFVFEFIEKNINNIQNLSMKGALSVYLEQSIFHQLSHQYGVKINSLFEHVTDFDFFYQIEKIPQIYYVHALGGAKRFPYMNEQISLNLLNEYPEYYNNIINNYQNFKY